MFRHAIYVIFADEPHYGQVALVLIDECHFLNENRGSALEAGAICRIKMIAGAASMEQVCMATSYAMPSNNRFHLQSIPLHAWRDVAHAGLNVEMQCDPFPQG